MTSLSVSIYCAVMTAAVGGGTVDPEVTLLPHHVVDKLADNSQHRVFSLFLLITVYVIHGIIKLYGYFCFFLKTSSSCNAANITINTEIA